MHEIGLCEAIMEAVERRAEGRRVSRVKVRVGARHRVAPPSFDQAFSLVSGGTVAEDATLDLELIPARITCRDCGERSEANDIFAVCPRCGSPDLEIEGGDDLMLESIDIRPGMMRLRGERVERKGEGDGWHSRGQGPRKSQGESF